MKIDSLNEKSPLWMIIIMSVPSILSQMIGLLNNVIDRMFVARIAEGGSYALAGLGIVVPIVTIYGAAASLVGRGVSPIASMQLGTAAIATVAGETVITVLNMSFLMGKDSAFTVKLSNCRLKRKTVKDILVYGFTPFFQASSEGLVQILFNFEMGKYGNDLYIAEMSIIFTISQFLYMPLNGISNGVQPILSYNYGKKDMEKTKRALLLACVGLTIFLFVKHPCC